MFSSSSTSSSSSSSSCLPPISSSIPNLVDDDDNIKKNNKKNDNNTSNVENDEKDLAMREIEEAIANFSLDEQQIWPKNIYDPSGHGKEIIASFDAGIPLPFELLRPVLPFPFHRVANNLKQESLIVIQNKAVGDLVLQTPFIVFPIPTPIVATMTTGIPSSYEIKMLADELNMQEKAYKQRKKEYLNDSSSSMSSSLPQNETNEDNDNQSSLSITAKPPFITTKWAREHATLFFNIRAQKELAQRRLTAFVPQSWAPISSTISIYCYYERLIWILQQCMLFVDKSDIREVRKVSELFQKANENRQECVEAALTKFIYDKIEVRAAIEEIHNQFVIHGRVVDWDRPDLARCIKGSHLIDACMKYTIEIIKQQEIWLLTVSNIPYPVHKVMYLDTQPRVPFRMAITNQPGLLKEMHEQDNLLRISRYKSLPDIWSNIGSTVPNHSMIMQEFDMPAFKRHPNNIFHQQRILEALALSNIPQRIVLQQFKNASDIIRNEVSAVELSDHLKEKGYQQMVIVEKYNSKPLTIY